MEDIETELRELGEKNGFDISLDENDACTLVLADGRPGVFALPTTNKPTTANHRQA